MAVTENPTVLPTLVITSAGCFSIFIPFVLLILTVRGDVVTLLPEVLVTTHFTCILSHEAFATAEVEAVL